MLCSSIKQNYIDAYKIIYGSLIIVIVLSKNAFIYALLVTVLTLLKVM